MFSWVSFLEDHRITYVATGPNVARNNVAIHCPFCGDADPSEHMGLNKTTGFWGCWRNKQHRGRKPHRLIIRLLGCSYEAADGFVDGGRELSRFEELASVFSQPGHRPVEDGSRVLSFPKEFRVLTECGLGRFYTGYLRRRGFETVSITGLGKKYRLQFCTSGYWHGRIIFPIYMAKKLVCWTGRTISKTKRLRYLSLSDKPVQESRQPLALCSIRDSVWNYDSLVSGNKRIVVIAEGPMDALKLDYYGRSLGVRATCLFGTGVTEVQKLLLYEIRQHCQHLLIIADQAALLNEMQIKADLAHLKIEVCRLPHGVEDPGAMSKEQVERLFAPI